MLLIYIFFFEPSHVPASTSRMPSFTCDQIWLELSDTYPLSSTHMSKPTNEIQKSMQLTNHRPGKCQISHLLMYWSHGRQNLSFWELWIGKTSNLWSTIILRKELQDRIKTVMNYWMISFNSKYCLEFSMICFCGNVCNSTDYLHLDNWSFHALMKNSLDSTAHQSIFVWIILLIN